MSFGPVPDLARLFRPPSLLPLSFAITSHFGDFPELVLDVDSNRLSPRVPDTSIYGATPFTVVILPIHRLINLILSSFRYASVTFIFTFVFRFFAFQKFRSSLARMDLLGRRTSSSRPTTRCLELRECATDFSRGETLFSSRCLWKTDSAD